MTPTNSVTPRPRRPPPPVPGHPRSKSVNDAIILQKSQSNGLRHSVDDVLNTKPYSPMMSQSISEHENDITNNNFAPKIPQRTTSLQSALQIPSVIRTSPTPQKRSRSLESAQDANTDANTSADSSFKEHTSPSLSTSSQSSAEVSPALSDSPNLILSDDKYKKYKNYLLKLFFNPYILVPTITVYWKIASVRSSKNGYFQIHLQVLVITQQTILHAIV